MCQVSGVMCQVSGVGSCEYSGDDKHHLVLHNEAGLKIHVREARYSLKQGSEGEGGRGAVGLSFVRLSSKTVYIFSIKKCKDY